MISFVIFGQCYSKANRRKLATFNGMTRLIKSAEALAYERDALAQIPPKLRLRLDGPMRITIWVYYENERSDLDASVILDCLQDRWKGKGETRQLVQRGVVRNDRQFRDIRLIHGIDKANPRAVITIEPMVPAQQTLIEGEGA